MIRKTIRTERYQTCYRCQGKNTEQIATGGATTESERVVFLGWCRDCRDSFGYSEWVDDVYDPLYIMTLGIERPRNELHIAAFQDKRDKGPRMIVENVPRVWSTQLVQINSKPRGLKNSQSPQIIFLWLIVIGHLEQFHEGPTGRISLPPVMTQFLY